MCRSYQALLCAILLLALFTQDSKAMSRVEQRGSYRPANVTAYAQPQQKSWQPQQQQSPWGNVPQPAYAATTRSPSQQWNNNNQWNPYNQSANNGFGNKNWNNYNQTINPWQQQQQQQQRYNNTPGGQLPSWNMPQRPYQNQSHLYPHLPAANVGRPTPARFNNQWNQTRLPPQQYPGGSGVLPPNQNSNWWANQNKTWNVQTTTPLPYLRPNANGYTGGQNPNWWNYTKGGSNAGWGNPSMVSNGSNPNYPSGQVTWANGWGPNPAANNQAAGWGGSSVPQNNPTGWGSTVNGQSGLPKTSQTNWPSNSGVASQNGLNNWQNNINGQSSSSGGGAQLAPLGGSSLPTVGGGGGAGGQAYSPSNSGGIPLAPLGGGSNAQPGWHSASSQQNPNAWNHGSSGSIQLAPLAPLSYGGGGGGGGSGSNTANSNRANDGASSYPYANMLS